MKEHQHLPNMDRLSVVSAVILLSYALTIFIHFPTQSLNIQFPGFFFSFTINFATFVSLFVTILAAAGSDWLISDHPNFNSKHRIHHWVVPSFTALVIGLPLDSLSVSSAWWAVFGLGGLLLVLVFITEYISVDPADMRFAIARVSLTAVSLALLLVLLIAIRGEGVRLYTMLAAVVPATGVVSAKILHLRLGAWKYSWAIGISIVTGQIATGFFYLPLPPLRFGLIMLGIIFGLITLAGNIEEKNPLPTLWIEPIMMISIFSILSIFI
ncbi:MAG: hypothetical protein NTZ74_00070 [Chloroflexi bacterium]|nr:hypothetical protein [Chloroflexota bacterium]